MTPRRRTSGRHGNLWWRGASRSAEDDRRSGDAPQRTVLGHDPDLAVVSVVAAARDAATEGNFVAAADRADALVLYPCARPQQRGWPIGAFEHLGAVASVATPVLAVPPKMVRRA